MHMCREIVYNWYIEYYIITTKSYRFEKLFKMFEKLIYIVEKLA